jgi:hypothetical protein
VDGQYPYHCFCRENKCCNCGIELQ